MTERQRQLFPHMPEQLFDSWIAAKFHLNGWPFPTDLSMCRLPFAGYTLGQLAGFRRVESVCQLEDIEDLSIATAEAVKKHAADGLPTPAARISGTKQRFFDCVAFIHKNGVVPSRLAGERRGGAIQIFDGYHRLAALMHCIVTGVCVPDCIPLWLAQT